MTVRYSLDASWQRYDGALLAGSPLRLFRTTAAGAEVLTRLECGDDVGLDQLVVRLLDAGAIHPCRPAAVDHSANVADRVTVVTPQYRSSRPDRDDATVHTDGRITVDDGSSPPLAGAALHLAVNRGPAAARNAARPLIGTEIVAFLDADVTIEGGWIEALLWHFDDPRVGLVAPRVTGEEGSPLDLGDQPARIRAGTRVSYVPGAALLVRVEALDAIGGFDEGLRFGEDVDLVWRLDEAGWRCRYDPSVTVWHAPRASWSARVRQHFGYGTAAAPLAARHPRALSPVDMNGWTAGAWGAAAAGHVVTAALVAVGSAAALERKLPWLPRRATFELAMRGHLAGGRQLAHAVRRAWWPLLAAAALVSRRARWVLVASILADARATPTDAAYAAGVWRGMWTHRSLAAIRPRLSAWPPRRQLPSPR